MKPLSISKIGSPVNRKSTTLQIYCTKAPHDAGWTPTIYAEDNLSAGD